MLPSLPCRPLLLHCWRRADYPVWCSLVAISGRLVDDRVSWYIKALLGLNVLVPWLLGPPNETLLRMHCCPS